MASRFRTAERAGMTDFLVRRLREADRDADAAFTVAELRRALLPYPRCREALGLTSKAEYDVTLLRLLDGDGLVVSDDPELDADVERELDSPEPALGILDDHAATVLRPGPRLERELTSPPEDGEVRAGEEEATAAPERDVPAEPAAPDREPSGEAEAPGANGSAPGADERTGRQAPSAEAEDTVAEAPPAEAADAAAEPGGCPACDGDLPEADGVRYCPHCGEDVQAPRCGDCGGELAAGWRYCPFCGSDRDG